MKLNYNKKLIITVLAVLSVAAAVIFGRFVCYKNGPIEYIRDRDGRITVYHGVNVSNSSKTAPDFHPWQSRKDFEYLRDSGFNLVRYLVFWEAIEPERDRYDREHLKEMLYRIRILDSLGIDVILDMHQDLYCRKFSGNGFPVWTLPEDGPQFNQRKPWYKNYSEKAVVSAYNNFWGKISLQSKYLECLKFILDSAGLPENVIAIDIMNEPFNGKDLFFEKNELSRFYDRADSLFSSHENIITCFEPAMHTSCGFPSFLSFRPGENSIYAPHYYDPFCYRGTPYTFLNRLLMKWMVSLRTAEASRFNTPLLFGETAISESISGWERYIDDFVRFTGRKCAGWIYYSHDMSEKTGRGLLDQKGNKRGIFKRLIRVYPQKIAGDNPRVRSENRLFKLTYFKNGSDKPTVIFIPEYCRNVRISANDRETESDGSYYFHYNDNSNKQSITIKWE